VHPVPHDRTADGKTGLEPLEERLFRAAQRMVVHEVVVLEEREDVSREVVRARARDGGNDRGRRLLVLGAVVLRQNAELLDRVLRERVAAARVLADDATLQDVVLEADAVDEHVHGVGALRTGLERLAELVIADEHSGRERSEVHEVAVSLRQVLDLLGGDVRRHFRRLHLHRRAADDRHFFHDHGVGAEAEVELHRRADLQRDLARGGLVRRRGYFDRVRARRQAGQQERPVRRRDGIVTIAAGGVGRGDFRVGKRVPALVDDPSLQRRGGGLRLKRRHHPDAEKEHQQPGKSMCAHAQSSLINS
jgi:hypothetical protein